MLPVDPLVERLAFGSRLGCAENHEKNPLGCDAVVEPRHALTGRSGRRRLEEEIVSDVGGGAACMVNLAEEARRQLDASGSEVALLLIVLERAFDVAIRRR